MNGNTICKKCGNPFGWHNHEREACPIGNFNPDNFNSKDCFSATDTFEADANSFQLFNAKPIPTTSEVEETLDSEKDRVVCFADSARKRALKESRAKLRKVEFSRKRTHTEAKDWTGCPVPEWVGPGWFHAWGLDTDDLGSTVLSYTVGIIEDESGQVWNVYPSDITFIS